MKTAASFIIGILFMATMLVHTDVSAKNHSKHQAYRKVALSKKQRSLNDAQGCTCDKLCENCLTPLYACGHSEQTQTIPFSSVFGLVFYPIHLEINVVTPVGIVHPVSGDDTQFQVLEDGKYLIQFHTNAQAINPSDPTWVYVQLRNVTANTILLRESRVADAVQAVIVTDTSQTLVELPAGTIIDMEAASPSPNGVYITNPTLVISRVAA